MSNNSYVLAYGEDYPKYHLSFTYNKELYYNIYALLMPIDVGPRPKHLRVTLRLIHD
jgi:hypothetical protein